MEEYRYEIGCDLVFEQLYFEDELVWRQGMTIETMLEVFIIDFIDDMMNEN